ncbi:hypothetical protein ENSA5_28700 [Enhygromyxa salina]|uniref:Uncharacterized protein n=1 Tax=Enhygromyxa salina TaxID=215803 RepID=A0A2S9Y450_9BACT|nr:hypothetical protein [Enhygromyxa salina]PRP99882.1 hypothetical protein ENSA5_28700 [Enhygromyxa salina]
MLAHLLSLLLLAPPQTPSHPSSAEVPAGEGEAASEPGPEPGPSEFGELEAAPDPGPNPNNPDDSASGGYGAVAPLPTYTEESAGRERDEAGAPPVVEAPPKPKKQATGFIEPEDFGPFYEAEPVSELRFPGDAHRPDRDQPFASVAGGTFCFVEDSACGAALIADADVGVGLNIITSDRGLDVPYTQFRVRGGLTVRPIVLSKKRWHQWGIGVVANWSLASGSITATNRDPQDPNVGVAETDPIRTYRIGLLNQLWLSQKRNALHLDFTLGVANSSVLDFDGRYWGTQAEIGVGFGGWGGLYLAGDFFDGDTRVFMGMRGHAIATGPLIALIVLGLVAGGVAL